MTAQRKIFRIEQMGVDGAMDPGIDFRVSLESDPLQESSGAAVSDLEAGRRHHELLAEIKALRALVQPQEDAQRVLDSYQAQIAEMQKLKGELVIIHTAITRTKQEIATLHVTGFHGENSSRMTHELDAVVNGTEQATQTILGMVEEIDAIASSMIDGDKEQDDKAVGQAIQDRVVKVFEACNFQDITGQRISKVVTTWKFIEGHIGQMMEIWGGIDAFKDFIPDAPPEPEGDDSLLNGPKLDSDAGHASQDDIDALFP
ncbi:MAG TPA: protein phosphatase CheZ [Xanthobacteraceae bacterium]|jgi:chemotaxis protein CheZ